MTTDAGRNDLNQTDSRFAMKVMFPTFVAEAWYPDYEKIKQSLLNRIRSLQQEDSAGQDESAARYDRGYTSYFTRNRLYGEQTFSPLVDFIIRQAVRYSAMQSWDMEQYQPTMTSLWCNINGTGSQHADHVHAYSHISGVFYIDCQQDSAPIRFKDPRPARWMVPPPLRRSVPENALAMEISPQEGKLLLFPSFLEHGVLPNQSQADRVSMSFNFEITPRKT
ncbi:MAG: TIGR02466 family protein [Pseudomonadales bacterium]|nr:TIGR02466 family protein [Pseudomonadales bacterium]